MSKKESVRELLLRDAAIVTGMSRLALYGDPTVNMDAFAKLWGTYASFATRGPVPKYSRPHDAAMAMVLAKVARIAVGARGHRDNYLDAAAYLAMAYEADCAATEQEARHNEAGS